jgi:hypothetical protein
LLGNDLQQSQKYEQTNLIVSAQESTRSEKGNKRGK